MKKHLNMSLRILMLALPFAVAAPFAAYAFSGGSGTVASPYLISSCTDLQAMKDSLAANYKLASDIDCSATTGWNGGSGFAPVGTSTAPFTGVLNGNGHTVSGLYINRPSTDDIGLFGYTNIGTTTSPTVDGPFKTIYDLSLTGVNITGRTHTGGLIGYYGGRQNSLLSTTSVSGSVTGYDYTGGLVGYAPAANQSDLVITDAIVAHSYSSATVSGHDNVGGLIGYPFGATGYNYASGNVSGHDFIGGLLGLQDEGAPVFRSYATGAVSGNNQVGGLIGDAYGDTFDCHADGSVTGVQNIGGLLGRGNNSVYNECYATGTVTGTTNVGGYIGDSESSNQINAFSTGAVYGSVAVGGFLGTRVDSGTGPTNSYWYDRPGDNATSCYSQGNSGCTKIDDAGGGIAYFYNSSASAPMSAWDFASTPVWDVASLFPILHWQSPVISSVASSPLVTSGTVTWTTDKLSDSTVAYGASSGVYTTSTSSASSVTSHSIGLTGLSAATTYYYVVVSSNAWRNPATSTEYTFTTFSPFAVTTSAAGPLGQTSVVLNGAISSTGGQTVSSRGFRWGSNAAYGATTTESGSFSAGSFTSTLSGLKCGTRYYFDAYAVGTSGVAYGSDQTLVTAACSGSVTTSSGGASGYPQAPVVNTQGPAWILSRVFNRDLSIGMSGSDVRALQVYLNGHGFPVAITGPGSKGQETLLFGSQTQAALARLQAARGISPAVGYFGPVTRAYVATHQ